MRDKKLLITGALIFCSISLNLSFQGKLIGAWLALVVILMIDTVWWKNQTIEMMEKTNTYNNSLINYLESLLRIEK